MSYKNLIYLGIPYIRLFSMLCAGDNGLNLGGRGGEVSQILVARLGNEDIILDATTISEIFFVC